MWWTVQIVKQTVLPYPPTLLVYNTNFKYTVANITLTHTPGTVNTINKSVPLVM